MIFRKRLYFFSIGLIIGIFLVMFIFRGKNASFNYMPNSRVIQNITSKDSIHFIDKSNIGFKKDDIKEIISNGKVDFKNSNSRNKPCSVYKIISFWENSEVILEIENCPEYIIVTLVD
jgi:hypothetical protein